jgi:hypothetical protein
MVSQLVSKYGSGALIALTASTRIALAQTAASQLTKIFCSVAGFLYMLALAVGVIYVVVAAFKYMSAAGDASKVSEAHKSLLWAAIGIGVAIIAQGFPNIVAGLLGGTAKGC